MREFRDPFVRKHVMFGHAKGLIEGEAESLIAVLTARGIDVPPEVRARIQQSKSPAQLIGWIKQAVTAETLDDVFGPRLEPKAAR